MLRGRKPPFDPASVAAEYTQLARQYRVGTVVGDAYAGQWVASAFQRHGVDYRRSRQPRSVLYLESMPAFMRGAVSIPDHSRVLRELRLLERRTSPSGKDSIDHGKNGSDDYANALCGCIAITLKELAADNALICGGKLFSLDTGFLVTDSSPLALAAKPQEQAELAKVQEASLRAQAAEMRAFHSGPPVSRELEGAAKERFEKWKADHLKQQSSLHGLHPKLFGSGR